MVDYVLSHRAHAGFGAHVPSAQPDQLVFNELTDVHRGHVSMAANVSQPNKEVVTNATVRALTRASTARLKSYSAERILVPTVDFVSNRRLLVDSRVVARRARPGPDARPSLMDARVIPAIQSLSVGQLRSDHVIHARVHVI